MYAQPSITVRRDVEATLIPTGVKVTLKEGTEAAVTQALGDSYTLYVSGNLVRISGKDGDALGLVVLDIPDINEEEGSVEDKVWVQLRTCFDPEIPVNIVDLGLVYACELRDEEGCSVTITMTLTAAGCGMGPVLVNEVEEKIRAIREVTAVKVDLTFDPPWDRDRMSDEAKLQLGLL